jgi:hypothetical protein
MSARGRSVGARLAALGMLASLMLPPVRHALEADMARHMLLAFPLAMALGALAFGRRFDAGFARIDRLGLTGWFFASLVLAYWMIPSALDAAIASPGTDAAKLASLALAGAALRSSWRRSPPMLEAFFVGNFAWMAATVGLVYQDAPAQLCLNYLSDSQQRAGSGLVVAAIACGAAWLYARRREVGLASVAATRLPFPMEKGKM